MRGISWCVGLRLVFAVNDTSFVAITHFRCAIACLVSYRMAGAPNDEKSIFDLVETFCHRKKVFLFTVNCLY